MKSILIKRLMIFMTLSLGLLLIFHQFEWPLWLVGLLSLILFFLTFKDYKGPFAVVLMYHGVSDRPEQYPLPGLVCHVTLFEKFLVMLKKTGFHFLSIDQFYEYKKGNYKLPAKSLLLNFDDGYLDNWVFAAPLLKKYDAQGAMFASQDFIEKSQRVRKRFDEVGYDQEVAKQLECLNYCSEKELQLMDQEGVIKVGAHAKSHSFYYSSNRIIGYYKQTEMDPFPEWNIDLDSKPFWMTNLTRKIPVGTPIFEYQPSCRNTKRYIPDPLAESKIGAYVRRILKDQTTFEQEQVDKIMSQHPGRFETEEETKERFESELIGVKNWLETLLGQSVDYLVWPHGGVSDQGIEMASKHYKLFQIPNSGISNRPRDPINKMCRFGGLELLGTPIQQKVALWKIRSKMEIGCGNYYWVLIFGLIKLLEKSKIISRARYKMPKQYNYNYNLIKS